MKSDMSAATAQPNVQPNGCPSPEERGALLVTAARHYAELGLTPILLYGVRSPGVCGCQGQPKECGGGKQSGKHPIGGAWQTKSLDMAELEGYLRHGVANIGLRMGRQRGGKCIMAVDVDDWTAFARVGEQIGMLPDTLTNTSPSGGAHFVFEVPADFLAQLGNWVKPNGAGFDLRVEGGQIAVGPSRHYSGGDYEMIDAPIAPLPEAWCNYLLSLVPAGRAPRESGVVPVDTTLEDAGYDRAQVGAWATEWLRAAGTSKVLGLAAPLAIEGQGGHAALLKTARGLLTGFGLDRDTAVNIAWQHYNPLCQPPWSEGDRDFERKFDEVERSDHDAFEPLELARRWKGREIKARTVELGLADALWAESQALKANDGEPAVAPSVPAKRANPLLAAAESWSDIQKPLPPVNWVCRDLDLAEGRPSLWFGDSGCGKTTTAMGLGLAVMSGQPAFGSLPVRRGAVVHINLDGGKGASRSKYQRLAMGMGVLQDNLPLMLISPDRFLLTNPESHAHLLEVCTGKALCIIDSLRRISTGDEKEMAFADPMIRLRHISEQTGCAIVLIHHAVKSQAVTGLMKASGTGDIGANAGSSFWIEKQAEGVKLSRAKTSDHDEVDEHAPINVALERGTEMDPILKKAPLKLTVSRESKGEAVSKEANDIEQSVRKALEESDGRSLAELARQCQRGEKTIRPVLEDLLNTPDLDRLLYRYKTGRNGTKDGFFLRGRNEMVKAALALRAMPEAEIIETTRLHKSEVKGALDTLRARGVVLLNEYTGMGSVWELTASARAALDNQ